MSFFWILPRKYLSFITVHRETKTRELRFSCKPSRSAVNIGKRNHFTLLMVYFCCLQVIHKQSAKLFGKFKTSICIPIMFLCSVLPFCSGHRLSGYLQVSGKGHCTCLEQIHSFGRHCPVHSETNLEMCLVGISCALLLQQVWCVTITVLAMQRHFCASRQVVKAAHMSDLQTCCPQTYFLSKSIIVCSAVSEIIRPTGTWWAHHSRRGTKQEVIHL